MDEEGSEILMFHEGGELVGCVHLQVKDPETLYFGMLVVRPGLQSKGTGSAIMRQIEEVAKERGHSKLALTVVNLRSELIAFYQRRGFVLTGGHLPFPSGDPRFGVPKVEGLLLLEMVKNLV